MSSAPESEEIYKVSTLELFFDLVFVFVVTQLTSVLVEDPSLAGLAQVVLQFGVLWWMYGGYAWLTNTLPVTTVQRKLLVIGGMAGFLVIGLATPTAFSADGGVFWGIGYLLLISVHGALYAQVNPNILRVVPANVLAGLLIIGAGLLDGAVVYVLWTLALLIPIALPYLVPVGGGAFRVRAEHIVERHGLLVIIAFGESVIAIGIGAKQQELTTGLVVAAVLGLALVAQLWWSYFDSDDERAAHHLTAADEGRRAQMTMNGYFYAHLPLLVGVIVMAAGLKKVLAHPFDGLPLGKALLLSGGVALYLAGDVLYRRIMGIGPSAPRLTAAAGALAVTAVGPLMAAGQLVALIAVLGAALVFEARRAVAAEAYT